MSRLNGSRKVRDRRRRNRVWFTLSLQAGLVISTVVVGGTQFTGPTYGEFASSRNEHMVFSACEVFPSQIESIMLQIVSNLDQANTLMGQLTVSNSLPTNPFIDRSTDGYSLEQYTALLDELHHAAAQFEAELQTVQTQVAGNVALWEGITSQLGAAEAGLSHLGQLTGGLTPACLPPHAITDSDLLAQRILQIVSKVNQFDSGLGAAADAYEDILSQLQAMTEQVQLAAEAQQQAELALAEQEEAKRLAEEEAAKLKEQEAAEQTESEPNGGAGEEAAEDGSADDARQDETASKDENLQEDIRIDAGQQAVVEQQPPVPLKDEAADTDTQDSIGSEGDGNANDAN